MKLEPSWGQASPTLKAIGSSLANTAPNTTPNPAANLFNNARHAAEHSATIAMHWPVILHYKRRWAASVSTSG